MEPTEDNRRAFDQLHGLRIAAMSDRPGIPDAIRELLPDLAGKHVLHLMCGTGEASAELAGLGGLVTAVDVWSDALAAAGERYPEIAFVHSDVHELPLQLQRRRLDFVYAGGGILRYVHDLDALATGMANALRPGGRLRRFARDRTAARGATGGPALETRGDRERSRAGGLPVTPARGVSVARSWAPPRSQDPRRVRAACRQAGDVNLGARPGTCRQHASPRRLAVLGCPPRRC